MKLNRQERLYQDYCNRVQSLNSTPLKQKAGEVLGGVALRNLFSASKIHLLKKMEYSCLTLFC